MEITCGKIRRLSCSREGISALQLGVGQQVGFGFKIAWPTEQYS